MSTNTADNAQQPNNPGPVASGTAAPAPGTPGATNPPGNAQAGGNGSGGNNPGAQAGAGTAPTNPPTEGTPTRKARGDDQQGERSYSHRQLNAIVNRKVQEAVQAVTEETNRQKQEAAGEFKALYEAEKAKNALLTNQLTTLTEQLETLQGTIESGLEIEVKDWPAEILAADPAKINPSGFSVVDRQAWIVAMRPVVTMLQGQPANPGNGPSPAPANPRGGPPANGAAAAQQGNAGAGQAPGTGQGGPPPETPEQYRERKMRNPAFTA